MNKLLVVFAYVLLILQQGVCVENTNFHRVACNRSDSNSRIYTGKKKPDERSQETADKCNKILDDTIQLFKDVLKKFLKNYNDKTKEDLQKSIGEMADDGYNKFYKKDEDGNDREYSNMYRNDLRNDVDISNRISISKRDITMHTSMKTNKKPHMQKSKMHQGRKEKQKPKKSRIMQLSMVGMYIKSIFGNLVKTSSIIVQIKLYIMGTILLIIESIRLYLDITRRRGRQKTRRKYNGWLTNKPNPQELAYRAHVPNYTQQQDPRTL